MEKIEKMLKWAIVVVYSALFILIGILVYRYCKYTKAPENKAHVEVLQDVSDTTKVEINGDNNVVNINVIPQQQNVKPQFLETYISQIAEIRWLNGDKKFTMLDALELLNKIEFYAKRNNLSLQSALTIVNVESDFNAKAYRKSAQAYGLTQLTPLCLKEYNELNNTNYTLDDLFDVDVNLEIGFWYFNRILTHYSDSYGYITTSTPEKALRDAYLAYNVGVTTFSIIGRRGRNDLRNGIYPCDMYGSKKGDVYEPMNRYSRLAMYWL